MALMWVRFLKQHLAGVVDVWSGQKPHIKFFQLRAIGGVHPYCDARSVVVLAFDIWLAHFVCSRDKRIHRVPILGYGRVLPYWRLLSALPSGEHARR